jgi:AbiV family abortive infection protein
VHRGGWASKIDRTFLSALVLGAEKTFDNAEKLYFETALLAKADAIARALCLQISLEECSKVENLGAWIASLLSGLPVDQNKVLAAFGRHSSKNKSNAYMREDRKPRERPSHAVIGTPRDRSSKSSRMNSTNHLTTRKMLLSTSIGKMVGSSRRARK